MLRCGPLDTASAPGGTSRRTTVPAPVAAPSPISTGATNVLLDAGPGVPADGGAVLGDAVVVGEDRARPRCWCPRRSRRRRRRTGAGPSRRRRSRRSWSRRRRRSCRRRRAGCRAAGRRTGRRRPAPTTASSPWVRTTRAPAPTSTVLERGVGADHGVLARRRWRRAAACRGGCVTSGASTTSASTQVVAGSMMVTPSRIHRVRMRRFSSRPSAASWTRSLAPSVCSTSSMTVGADGQARRRGRCRRCR